MTPLVIATRNKGKLEEIRKALASCPIKIHSLTEFQEVGEIVEDSQTFEGNALKKARVACQVTGSLALGDDSGLVVPTLGGEPGVLSARYARLDSSSLARRAGPAATADDNNKKLLDAMKRIPVEKRGAIYVCVLALVLPTGKERLIRATCEGVIAEEPKGDGGFGYDPIFFLPILQKTMAQISLEEKNRLSHRGRALEELKKIIPYFL
ncbi:MAG: RdgB/HAM1 family non-canonical purine NTP pyrophosphatase [Deltaproteobacteria bacterium]|nr:RdgB/HAM1 family non-canonical purine NTP pyrophosphatase [Deltaproteobacteria bacterium]